MARKTCIFCRRKNLTKEHLFSDWMKSLFRGPSEGYRARYVKEKLQGETTFKAGVPTGEIRCVCGKCNSGWMSHIETVAQPILTRMIRGERVALDRDAQEAVATWASLKAIVGQAMNASGGQAPLDWRTHLYRARTPPDDWVVGLAAYKGQEHQAFYEGLVHNLTAEYPDGTRETLAGKRVHASFIIHNLAIKVLGLRGERLTYPGSDSLIFIWPTSPLTLLWPPPLHVDDSTVETFRNFGLR